MARQIETAFPILIVEDNPVSRELIRRTIERAGYSTACAENGRQALEMIKRSFFPVVITDWIMPEMDGLELCRAIRNARLPGYVFIIFLTSKESSKDIIEGLEAGADDYLTKPFHDAELTARLKTGKRIIELERSLKKALDEIKRLSILDPLTKTYNRSYLNEHLVREMKKAERYRRTLSLIMCDIDRFKHINDTHGHPAGDAVLRAFCRLHKRSIRDGIDWMARYGGEEFVIVLPDLDLDGAVGVAERLRGRLCEGTIWTKAGGIRVTASYGVAMYRTRAAGGGVIRADALLESADRMLYLAKKQGGNRVVGEPECFLSA